MADVVVDFSGNAVSFRERGGVYICILLFNQCLIPFVHHNGMLFAGIQNMVQFFFVIRNSAKSIR